MIGVYHGTDICICSKCSFFYKGGVCSDVCPHRILKPKYITLYLTEVKPKEKATGKYCLFYVFTCKQMYTDYFLEVPYNIAKILTASYESPMGDKYWCKRMRRLKPYLSQLKVLTDKIIIEPKDL